MTIVSKGPANEAGTQPYSDGLEFILGEVIRYAQMSWPEMKQHAKDIAFQNLEDVQGRKRPAGGRAIRRLEELTEQTLAASPFGRRLDLQRTLKLVRERFGPAILNPDRSDLSEGELRTLFEGWITEAAQDCLPRVHIMPCNLGLRGAEHLRIGPVTLHKRASFWPVFEAELEAYLAETEPAEWKSYRPSAVEEARTYLSSFGELAEVAVPDCDGPTSRAVAQAALQLAIDYIHLLAGAAYTSRMRGPGPALGNDPRSTVVREAGRLKIGSSLSWGGASISEGAWRQLAGPDGAREVAPVASALQRIVERRDLPLIADRFVDACGWYGDAVREASPAAAAVKYVTVIERLLWTGERHPGVTQRTAERLAALCFSTETWNYDEIEAEVKDVYNLRSGLLHGRISKNDPDVVKRLRHCERHARDLLLTWLERFGEGFDRETTIERLGEYLNGFTREARAAAREARAGGGG